MFDLLIGPQSWSGRRGEKRNLAFPEEPQFPRYLEKCTVTMLIKKSEVNNFVII
jgi:hypothetical protein